MEDQIIQMGEFSKCELNVLIEMYMDGHEIEYIAEVLFRSPHDVKKEIKFKGLFGIRVQQYRLDNKKLSSVKNQLKFQNIMKKHCDEPLYKRAVA